MGNMATAKAQQVFDNDKPGSPQVEESKAKLQSMNDDRDLNRLGKKSVLKVCRLFALCCYSSSSSSSS